MEFKNKYGRVVLERDHSIIIGHFHGNINANLVYQFSNSIFEHIKPFAGRPWAYISNSYTACAATPEAEEQFTHLAKQMMQSNCIASAYILGSSLVVNQMQRIMNNAGLMIDIKSRLFTDLYQAKEHINEQLKLLTC
ncbi:hypothetical protein AMS58_18770 [Pseudoalteromonas porphyrae]|uniref:Uncharacterized protein n=1 Tax=Pseudoalteromonas porphyrae TaxID=187330 RepID=A0A0N0LW41_9GAMM|nr:MULTISPECIES: hypothetical protein [Pseudoalteromonas]KPH58299.1 hypothetical protein ADS77_18135 [Pseudoalteromonas porphyrae]KPH93205.1 hypothetical protein AMS58_18770 [Pseudoalteromonas porphyrae]